MSVMMLLYSVLFQYWCLVIAGCLIHPVVAFVAAPFRFASVKSINGESRLYAEGSDELDSLRKVLETAWNVETMGKIPSDPTDSAEEAVEAIQIATERGVNVFFVDLLLPSYDIKQGTNLYDEVRAVEYCIEISNRLEGKSSILVRNGNILESVSRVLDARERDRLREQGNVQVEAGTGMGDDVGEGEQEASDDSEDGLDTEILDSASDSDLDSFRQQLISSWDIETSPSEPTTRKPQIETESSTPSDLSKDKNSTPEEEDIPLTPSRKVAAAKVIKSSEEGRKEYRLASLFGNSKISDGADMIQDVVKALRLNALPEENEENMIILSAVSRAEMVAVRTLVDKYEGQKNIILVNCKLDPIPNELRRGETVYSILPLIAKQITGNADGSTPPKVVVMRRYPADWEVFVDIGTGFQLAETAPVFNQRTARGPNMNWVTNCVQRYLRRNA